MEFEWDENKNKSNQDKHGVDFNKAKDVFNDENKIDIDIENSEEKYGEKRKIVIGAIVDIIHTVVYTIRNSVCRIISARAASKKERKLYNNLNS
ncbi:MAG: BrnT family toxin [Bacteroidota bacterium]|nr:BrnT family toxin [Bacteroidota bacterium]